MEAMKKNRRKPFTQLTQFDRDRIQSLRYYGHSQEDIAEALERDPGTISREFKRYTNKHGRYKAIKAQKKAEENRKGSKSVGMKIENNPSLRSHIIKSLQELRSPDEIAGRMRRDKVSPRVGKNAIYKWLYSEYGKEYCQYLCSRKTRKVSQSRLSKRQLIPDRIPLEKRPVGSAHVHGESDLFVSPTRLHVKTVGHMTVVKETKLLMGRLLQSKSPTHMVASMRHIQKKVAITTWTMDNGIENIHHGKFGIPTYFCDKGSPWQKPDVESGIGLTRRWFLPKGTDLSHVPDDTFQAMLHVLNDKYRRSLGYANSYEASLDRAIITKVPLLSKKKAVAFR